MFVCKKQPSNGVDRNAVTVICLNNYGKEEVVDLVPQNISKVISLYLSLPHFYLEPEVTGKFVNRGGPEKATQWLETRLSKIEEQLKESEKYYLK